jgi:hypothetical protein
MFTMVASSTTINWARATTARIHHRFGEAAGGVVRAAALSGALSVRDFCGMGAPVTRDGIRGKR